MHIRKVNKNKKSIFFKFLENKNDMITYNIELNFAV